MGVMKSSENSCLGAMRKKPFKFVGLHEDGHNFISERCRYITKDNRGTLQKDMKNMIPLLINLLVNNVNICM